MKTKKLILSLIFLVGSLLSFPSFAEDPPSENTVLNGELGTDNLIQLPSGSISDLFSGGSKPNYEALRKNAEAAKEEAEKLRLQILGIQNDLLEKKSKYSNQKLEKYSLSDELIQKLTQEALLAAPSPIIELTDIPDPDESALPYHFISNDTEFKTEIVRIYKNLYKIQPYYENRQTAKQLGLVAVHEADQSFALEKKEDAYFFKEIAQEFLDMAVGLDPITGLARSAYEVLTGKNFVNGNTLSSFDRSLAFVGLITAGNSRTASRAGQGLYKIFQGASHLLKERNAIAEAVHVGENLINQTKHLLKDWKKNHKIINIVEAEVANGKAVFNGYRAPYQEGSYVIYFETVKDSTWVRVHGEKNKIGNWLLRASSIRGLTPKEVRTKFALPRMPIYVTEVHVPAGTVMSRGNVQYHQFQKKMLKKSKSGAIQYRTEQTISKEHFKNTKRIGV